MRVVIGYAMNAKNATGVINKKHRLFIGTFYKILENSNDQIVKTPVLLLGNLLELFFKLYWERDVSSGLIRLDGHVKSLPCF